MIEVKPAVTERGAWISRLLNIKRTFWKTQTIRILTEGTKAAIFQTPGLPQQSIGTLTKHIKPVFTDDYEFENRD